MVSRESASAPGLRRRWIIRLRDRVAARLAWVWQPLLYGGVLIGFLMGRAIPISQISPFGIAFYVGVRGAGFGGLAGFPVALAIILGSFSALPAVEAITVALALGMTHLLAGLMKPKAEHRPLVAALLAAAMATVPALLQTPRAGTLQMVFWSSLTAVLGLVFTLAIGAVSRGRRLRIGSSDLPVPAIVLLASALTGLHGLTLWGGQISLHGVAAGLVVMVCAYTGGLALGAAAGAVLGISFFFTVIGSPPPLGPGLGPPLPEAQAMAYVIAGFLAGAFRDLKKLGVGLAYTLAFVSYTTATQGQGAVLGTMALTAVTALGLFWLLPRRWMVGIPAALTLPPQPDRSQAQAEKEGPVPDALERMRSMAGVLKEVQRTLHQVAAVGSAHDPKPERLFEQATERVCRSCSLYSQCWHKEFDRSYQLFSDLWTQIEAEGPLPISPPPAELEQHCIHPEQILFTLNYLQDLEQARRSFARQLDDGRSIAGDYIKNVARLLERMAEEVEQARGRGGSPIIPVFKVTAGIARLPKRGGHISGDSYEVGPLQDGRYLMALSDGMGVGGEAADQSRQSVRLLHQLLDAGFTSDVAVRTVNSVLLMRSPNDTFATVDLTLFDMGTGRAEFVKVGAAPSFVKRGSDVTVVKMPSVPIGIINQVEVEPEYRNLRSGDLVIMVTDGIWDVSKDDIDKERWLVDFLSREQTTDPEELAERLLARALTLAPTPEDDLTALVCKVSLISGSEEAAAARKKPAGEWAPAQLAPRFKPAQSSAEKS